MARQSSKTISTLAACLGLASLLIALGCSAGPQAPDTRTAADEAAIRLADSYWVKVAQSKQVDAWMAFYAEDAVVLPPNEKIATGKASIRKSVSELLGLPS